MKIAHPYFAMVHTKEMGIPIPIPKTELECRIYPAKIAFFKIGEEGSCYEIELDIEGPIQRYLVKVNISIGRIEVSFQDKNGFYSYFIETKRSKVVLFFDRVSSKGLRLFTSKKSKVLHRKETYAFPLQAKDFEVSKDVLELGVHKERNWQRICERTNLLEIIPIWMRFGQFFSAKMPKSFPGSLQLLKALDSSIKNHKANQIEKDLLLIFQVGFEGILSPRLSDIYHQAILQKTPKKSLQSATILLSQGAYLLRLMFVQEKGEKLYILPCLPQLLRTGRYFTYTKKGDELAFEWSNGQPKLLTLRSNSNQTIALILPKEIKQVRLRESPKDKGSLFLNHILNPEKLYLKKNQKIFLDHFEK